MNKIDEKAIWTLAMNGVLAGEPGETEAIIRQAQAIVNGAPNFELTHSLTVQQGMALALHNTAGPGGLTFEEPPPTVFSRRDWKIARRAMVDLINQQIADILGLGLQAKISSLDCNRRET